MLSKIDFSHNQLRFPNDSSAQLCPLWGTAVVKSDTVEDKVEHCVRSFIMGRRVSG